MNWTEWYRKTGNSTVYWYATGKRIGLSDILSRTFSLHRAELLENMNQHNGFLAYMRGKSADELIDDYLWKYTHKVWK